MEACRHFGVQRLVYISSPRLCCGIGDQLVIKEEAAPTLYMLLMVKADSEAILKFHLISCARLVLGIPVSS